MKVKTPRWVLKFLCTMGIHIKYKWEYSHKECICGEVRWL